MVQNGMELAGVGSKTNRQEKKREESARGTRETETGGTGGTGQTELDLETGQNRTLL
jgi:hypothetical protein